MRVSIRSTVLAASVVTATALCGMAHASVLSADVGKNLEFLQLDNAGTTVPVGASNAFFFARAFYNSGAYDNGSVTFSSTTLPFNSIAFDCCGSTGGQYQTSFITKADMDATFPTGVAYTLTLTKTGNPGATTSLDVFLPDDLYAATPIPTFAGASVDSLNSLTPGQAITIGTGTFTPDPAADAGQNFLSIYDLTSGMTIYSDFGSNTRSSWAVGSGIFQAGHSYEAQLIFDSLVAGSSGGVPTVGRDDLRTDLLFSLPGVVPEPTQWALMLMGFGLIGAALRRPRALRAPTA
ncbi:PEPxxWA-CTERM sorting domain-containing protein [Phenylobacterium sp.]|uniref:PEPxxWA-CTERM sorting domain-containing protein n=1 Tax=Phenylobacterium sp. TaxID=1871053 RepID=UPI0025D2D90C|nr:PEPxxWA-CTERM sorting domain-containing protein [Phenylobacterium sp.]